MAKLREVCESVGCDDVTTYIASGNVVCHSRLSAAALRRNLEAAIERRFGLQITLVVMAAADFLRLADDQPFPHARPPDLHVALAAEPVDPATARTLEDLDFDGEELAVRGRAIYFHLPNGYGRAKLPGAVNRTVKVPITVRNWRTVTALRSMLAEA